MRLILLYKAVACMLLFSNLNNSFAQNKIFVSSSATGGANNGTSWTNAFTNFQIAISSASSGDSVFVAGGTYQPSVALSFSLKEGVKIFGSFQGTESYLHQRDLSAGYTSILEGNLSSVIHHVSSLTQNTVLDGFTITHGSATSGANLFGGGIYFVNCSPILRNLKIKENEASGNGGGVYLESSSPTFINVTIELNSASESGGGIWVGANCSPTFDHVKFISNQSNEGAGMYNNGSPVLTNSSFNQNNAVNRGGAIMNLNSSASISLTDVIISANEAYYGAGIINFDGVVNLLRTNILGNSSESFGGGIYTNAGTLNLTNVVISNNIAVINGGGITILNSSTVSLNQVTISANVTDQTGGGIHNDSGAPLSIYNSIILGNTSNVITTPYSNLDIKNSLIEGFYDGQNGNINPAGIQVYDVFVQAIAPGSSLAGDFRLFPCSPVINMGNNALLPSGIITDIDGNSRVNGSSVDLGAYESNYNSTPASVLYVDSTATGTNTGDSWANAFPSLGYALAYANCTHPDTILVAAGTYMPDRSMENQKFVTPGHPENSFVLLSDVKILGGYPSGGGVRDIANNPTILDGEGYSAHVLIAAGDLGSAELNGFTITRGGSTGTMTTMVNGYQVYDCSGGGMYASESSPLLKNLIFEENHVGESGGGYFGYISSPTLENVVFRNNTARNGGGMGNQNKSNATLTNVVFEANEVVEDGGGLYSIDTCAVVLNEVVFKGNNASRYGGGVACGDFSTPIFTNVLISGNKSYSYGGGMYNSYYTHATLMNVTIAGNSSLAETIGIGLHNASNSYANITNSIIFGNKGINAYTDPASAAQTTFAYSLVEGLTDESNGNISSDNINYNSIFVTPLDTTAAPTLGGDYQLAIGSPAINTGTNIGIPATDIKGIPRPFGGVCDMGAYENQDCSSAIEPSVTVSQTDALTLEASSTGANLTYQWIDCVSGTAIPNTTGSTFVATENGEYAVVVSNGICSDTSSCITINQVGLDESTLSNFDLQIYPNPTQGKVTFVFDASETIQVQLFDLHGKLIQSFESLNSEDSISMTTLENGMYIFQIQTSQGIRVERIVKR